MEAMFEEVTSFNHALHAPYSYSSHRHGASVDGARVFGSTTQGEWLQRMGIVARLEALLALEDITERQVDQLITACERLVDPAQMGERYRVLAVVDEGEGVPAGFAAEDRVAAPPADGV